MVYRLSWVAGAGALLLALARLGGLLRPAAEGPPWQLALVAAAVLGLVITRTALSYGLGPWWIAGLNAAGLALAATRIAAPDTTLLGFLPTAATVERMGMELSFALDIIRHGTAPVVPVAGLVVMTAVAFWILGALLVWGLLRGRPYHALVPPLLFYLQLAVIDHRPSTLAWQLSVLAVMGGTLAALAIDQRTSGAGLFHLERRPVGTTPRLLTTGFVATLAAAALLVGSSGAAAVPPSGLLDWRTSSGLGGGFYGSVAYNPFLSIHQQLVSQSDTPVFVARLDGPIPPERISWRLITLDVFNGRQWLAGGLDARIPDPGEPWEHPDFAFSGPTATVVQEVAIQQLRMEWLPAVYSPGALASPAEVLRQGFRVRDDGSLRFDARTYPGLSYSIRSEVPRPDLSTLASIASGSLSPLFARAANEGATDLRPTESRLERRFPEGLDHFLELPDDLDPLIRALARDVTRTAVTDFERAVLLERWFRDPANFTYSTRIEPGHSADDLALWLTDPGSPNYRTGYCEQFATGMGVMARAVGIPSRTVLGFTPGEPDGRGNVIVRDRNAHAWVELWLPSQGWVPFDPTPRGDGINPATADALTFDPREFQTLPEATALPGADLGAALDQFPEFQDPGPTPNPPGGFILPGTGGRVIRLPGVPLAIPVLALPLVALPLYKWRRRRRRLARLADGDVTAAWEEIVDRLTDLGHEVNESLTPFELAARTAGSMTELAGAYGETIYGPGRPSASTARLSAALRTTETVVAEQHPPIRRMAAWYSLRSLRR